MEYSGNGGSLQSSSAEEEFDSGIGGVNKSIRTIVHSTTRRSRIGIHNNTSSLQPPQAPAPSSSFFDTLWAPLGDSNSYPFSGELLQQLQQQQQQSDHVQQTMSVTSEPAIHLNTETPATATTAAAAALRPQQATPTTRGSRKRNRASRRAPTTVLTTDTSNFRAMVQEFTGIPSPPFSAGTSSSSLLLHHRPRPDFVNPASSSWSPFIHRPFAQKFITTTTNTDGANPSSNFANSFQDLLAMQSSISRTTATQNPSIASLQVHQPLLPMAPATGNSVVVNENERSGPSILEKGGEGMAMTAAPAKKGISSSNQGVLDSWICSSDRVG